MSRLDDAIANTAHILDCLMACRNITQLNNCNECINRDCVYRPEPGRFIRYNCPFFKGKEDKDQ